MKISVITQDQVVLIDGLALPFSFQVPNGEWAIHFDTETNLGEVEYIDSRLNETIRDFSHYQYLVTLYQEEQARLEAEAEAARIEAERLAAEEAAQAEAEAQADTAA